MVFNWLFFTSFLFYLSLFGIIYNYKNLIITLMMIEILLFSIILNFVFFSVSSAILYGYFYTFLLLGIAAAETTLGLTLVVCYFKVSHKTLKLKNLKKISI